MTQRWSNNSSGIFTGGLPTSAPDKGPSVRRRSDGRLTRAATKAGGERVGAGKTRGFLVTRLRWIVLVMLLTLGAAAFVSWSRTPTYDASADVTVQPRVFSPGTVPQAPDMGTEKAVATSTAVLERASRLLQVPVTELSHGLSVSVPLNTTILHVSYSSPSPGEAQRRAQAVASSYVVYWLAQQPLFKTTSRTPAADIVPTAIISPAARPSSPSSPNHVVDMVIATIIGLMIAVGTAFIRDRLDDRLRSPHEFEDVGGGPVLAVIPAVRQRRGDPGGGLVTVRSPQSAAAHAYQDLRTRVFRAAGQRNAKTLLVTSPAGERQTILAANLAIALAQAGQHVTLVCADLRWPHGHELFGEHNSVGLASVIEGRAALDDAIRATDIPGMHVLPAGSLQGDYGAALHSAALRRVIGRLRTRFDFVVIDAPPALAGADTGALAELADMVLLVGDARHTTRRQMTATVEQLGHVSDRIIGCVVDNFGHRMRVTRSNEASNAVEDGYPGVDTQSNGWGDVDWLIDSDEEKKSAELDGHAGDRRGIG
jgi:polysaccharide biosynthesis transport protein